MTLARWLPTTKLKKKNFLIAEIGWNERQCDAIVVKGFESLDNLGETLLKSVSHICTTISKLPADLGRVHIATG